MSVVPPTLISNDDFNLAIELAEDMKRRGKKPSDLNRRGVVLLERLKDRLEAQGYSSYSDYATRSRQAALPTAQPTPTPAPQMPQAPAPQEEGFIDQWKRSFGFDRPFMNRGVWGAVDLLGTVANIPFRAVGGTVEAAARQIPGVRNYAPQIGQAAEVASGVAFPAAQARLVGAASGLASVGKAGAMMLKPVKSIPEIVDPAVVRVREAIRAAKPVRVEQEALYTAERGRRLGASLSIGKREPTVAGTRRQLAALRGELPRPQYEPLKIDQKDMNSLVKMVEDSPAVVGWDKIKARAALLKLFSETGAHVPQEGELALLGEVYGRGFVEELARKRPFLQKVSNWGAIGAGTAKAISASIDMSAPFRQAIFAGARHPVLFAKNFKPMFQAFKSEAAYRGIAAEIASRPNFTSGLMERANLALSSIHDILPTAREEAYAVSQFAERLPGVRASNRAYSTFLTKLRADIFDSMVQGAQKTGVALTDAQLERMGGFINTATGRGSLGGLAESAGSLATVLFSPRLIASRLQMLNPLYYHSLDPFTRKEAIKTAAAFFGVTSTALMVAARAGAKVETDYRNADFGKIRVGNTRYDVTGGFQNYLRFGAQMALWAQNVAMGKTTPIGISSTTGRPITDRGRPLTGWDVALNFVTGKFSPLLSGGKEFLKGETFEGPISLKQQVIDRFAPLFLQDLKELYDEGGVWETLKGIPGFFGVGVQTYRPRRR